MKCRCDSDKRTFFDGQTAKYSALDFFLSFIVTAQRGNNIFPFYRHRAAREQYFCRFIVTVQRGNDILPFYLRRAAFLQMHLLRL